jgi:hypothetical protein
MRASILLALAALSTVQAAEPTGTLTLACDGTATTPKENAKPQPVSMGIVVNFTARTVHGFPYSGFDLQIMSTQRTDYLLKCKPAQRIS